MGGPVLFSLRVPVGVAHLHSAHPPVVRRVVAGAQGAHPHDPALRHLPPRVLIPTLCIFGGDYNISEVDG